MAAVDLEKLLTTANQIIFSLEAEVLPPSEQLNAFLQEKETERAEILLEAKSDIADILCNTAHNMNPGNCRKTVTSSSNEIIRIVRNSIGALMRLWQKECRKCIAGVYKTTDELVNIPGTHKFDITEFVQITFNLLRGFDM